MEVAELRDLKVRSGDGSLKCSLEVALLQRMQVEGTTSVADEYYIKYPDLDVDKCNINAI